MDFFYSSGAHLVKTKSLCFSFFFILLNFGGSYSVKSINNNYIINAIGFNIGYLANEYRIGDKIDVAGVLEINTFNGVDNLQINIKDIMKSI